MNTTNTSNSIVLPKRVDGATVEALTRTLGLRLIGEEALFFNRYETPTAGWTIVDSDESPYQKRLVNGAGEQVAKIFYKEMFHSGSVQLIVAVVPPTIVLPKRLHNNVTVADLERTLGLKFVREHELFFALFETPTEGWHMVASGVSPYQLRLVNGAGEQVAKVFYKESFHSGSVELMVPVAPELDAAA
jgi:hypothetical protein